MSVTSIPVSAFRYTADGAQAIAETIKVRQAVESLNDATLEEIVGQFGDLDLSVSGISEKIAGFASAGALLGLIKQGADFVNEISDAAERAGTTAESLSRLKFAAEQSDVSFEALTTGIRKFQEGLSQAAIGEGAVSVALNEIGLSAANLKGLKLEDQLGLVADAFSKIEDQTDRVRISNDLFSKSSRELILLLAQGKDGIEALTKQAGDLGLALDNRATAAVDRGTKALERLGAALLGAGARVAQQIALTLTDSGDAILEAQAKIENLQQRRLAFSNQNQLVFAEEIKQLDQKIAKQKELIALEIDRKTAKNTAAPFTVSPAGRADLGGIPDLLQIDDGSDARRAAEKAAEELRRQDERIRDDMIAQREKFNELFREQESIVAKQVTDDLADEVERRNEIERNGRERILAQEQAFQDQILTIRRQGVSAAQILLTAYGGKFAAVGKAILLVEKANAIKSTFINTREAIMKTFAKYGGTPIGYASAAALAVLGAAQIAAIAAQGTSGGGGTGGGGNVGSGPTNNGPGFDPVTNPSAPFVNNAAPTATQVIIQGNVFGGRETADWIIEQIREAVDKRDVVIVGSDSRQAQEIMRR